MASGDALFGTTIASAANAAPEDIANDVTFGDIGDIRAGDAASEQHWAPDHDALAKAIEAEKEAILHLRRDKEAQQEHAPAPIESGVFPMFERNHSAVLQPQMQMEQQNGQNHHSRPPFSEHPSVDTVSPAFRSLSSAMSPGRPMMPTEHAYPRAPQTQQQQFIQTSASHPQHPPDLFERRIQALQQQQHLQLIAQQQAQSQSLPLEMQMRLQAQQKIQAQSQQPLPDMQMIMQAQQNQQAQSQPPPPEMQRHFQAQHNQRAQCHPPTPEMQLFLQAQQRQQMQRMHQMRQQQAQPPPPEVQMFLMAQQRLIQQHQNMDPVQLRHLLHQHHQQFIAASNARAAASATGFPRASPPPAPSVRAHGPTQSAPVQAMPPLPSQGLSLADLEKSLLATRIAEKPPRRMESMTDKDLEVVLRMHLRQLDTSIPYRDDFYSAMYGKESGLTAGDMYEALGQHLRDLEGNEFGPTTADLERGKRKRGRPHKRDEKETPGVHTSSNLKTLTHALGTIQSWNPKAPRRLMDLGAGDGKTVFPAVHKAIEDDGKRRLMCDDERVAVRVAVEDGYDLLGKLQDVTRKKAAHDTNILLERLFDTLHLSGERNSSHGAESFMSTRFFIRMCVFEKGKRYISRLLTVLRPVQAVCVITAVFENLSMLLYAIAPRAAGDSPDELWEGVMRTIQSPSTPAERCLSILDGFSRTHASDGGSLVIVLSSAIGARLLYVTMQRIFSVQGDGASLTKQSAAWRDLCCAISSKLGDVFDAAESSKSVWEVAAMLDALSEGQTQGDLRSTLKNLLDSGRAPPPPGT